MGKKRVQTTNREHPSLLSWCLGVVTGLSHKMTKTTLPLWP